MSEKWPEWEKFVVDELKRHAEDHKEIQKELGKIHVQIATLKLRASIWGAVGAAIPAIAVIAFEIIRK